VAEALDTTFEQTPTRVVRAEHLVAITLQTGRNKERERLASFIAEVPLTKPTWRVGLSGSVVPPSGRNGEVCHEAGPGEDRR
jgi:hypothetical protein